MPAILYTQLPGDTNWAVLVAIETSEHNKLKNVLDILFDFSDQILVKVTVLLLL